jgi:hypothetical protein
MDFTSAEGKQFKTRLGLQGSDLEFHFLKETEPFLKAWANVLTVTVTSMKIAPPISVRIGKMAVNSKYGRR